MDRPGVRQVPEGSGEQGKMEETGCKIICGAPTTLAVKGLMMMMIMMMMTMMMMMMMMMMVVAASALKDRALRTWQLSTKTPVLGDPGLVLKGSMLSHHQTASTQSLLASKHSIFLPTLRICNNHLFQIIPLFFFKRLYINYLKHVNVSKCPCLNGTCSRILRFYAN